MLEAVPLASCPAVLHARIVVYRGFAFSGRVSKGVFGIPQEFELTWAVGSGSDRLLQEAMLADLLQLLEPESELCRISRIGGSLNAAPSASRQVSRSRRRGWILRLWT